MFHIQSRTHESFSLVYFTDESKSMRHVQCSLSSDASITKWNSWKFYAWTILLMRGMAHILWAQVLYIQTKNKESFISGLLYWWVEIPEACPMFSELKCFICKVELMKELPGPLYWWEEIPEACPMFSELNYDIRKFSQKFCTEEGTWWIHPDSNR